MNNNILTEAAASTSPRRKLSDWEVRPSAKKRIYTASANKKVLCSPASRKRTYDEKEEPVVDIDMQTENAHLKEQCTDLVQENTQLKTYCNTLKSEVNALTLQLEYKDWEYAAEERIPLSHWKTLGFDGFMAELFAHAVKGFIQQLKHITDELRRGESTSIELDSDFFPLRHADILLPHWQEFVDALQQYQRYGHCNDHAIGLFIIQNIELHPKVLAILAPVLKTLSMKKFVLRSNKLAKFGNAGVSFMVDIVESNPNLTHEVGFFDNKIESTSDMRRLCTATRRNNSVLAPPLTTLGLMSHTFDGNNQKMVQTILKSSRDHIKELWLCENGIGLVGAHVIANYLASNPPLETLDLRSNDLNDDGARLLANTLPNNNNLSLLDLGGNVITKVGRQAFLGQMFDVSNLNACSASNHTCRVNGLEPDISSINAFEDAKENRAMKIMAVFSATDDDDGLFDMSYLDNVSYKVIPTALCLAQRFAGVLPELSDIYVELSGRRGAEWNQLGDLRTPLASLMRRRRITSVFEMLRVWVVPLIADE